MVLLAACGGSTPVEQVDLATGGQAPMGGPTAEPGSPGRPGAGSGGGAGGSGGDETDSTAPVSVSEDAKHAVAHAARRGRAPDRVSIYNDLSDLLPNARYKYTDGSVRPIVDRVINGNVTAVEPGFGFVDFGKKKKDNPLSFDDSSATWKTVHLTVDVVDQIGSSADEASTVRVGIAVNPNVDVGKLREGFLGASSYLLFLYKGSPVFGYDKDIYGMQRDGALLTEVLADGRLDMVAYDGEEEHEFLGGLLTLEDVQAAAARPDRAVETVR
jgi:hypothetical protein